MRRRTDSTSSDKSTASCSSVSRIPISRTPVLPRRQRSASSTLERHRSLQSLHRPNASSLYRDDDNESLQSGISCCSSSGNCDHAPFARNGTTWSGRGHRYIVHCSPSSVTEPGKYLTPTQRANSTIRRLESLVNESQSELREKEREISRLTRELVELRFGKVELDDIDETEATNNVSENGHLDSSTPVQSRPRLNVVDSAVTVVDAASGSLGDSGHFEDISPGPSPRSTPNGHGLHDVATPEAKIELILQRLAEANERYFELRPQYDQLRERLRELEKEKESVETKFKESEERHKQTYLQMFNKGQEAALFDVDQTVSDGPARGIPQLLKELEVTKAELDSVKTMYRRLLETKKTKSEQDAEVTLQFLKSAFYYFLTDRENTSGHLAAIQSILGFSQEEKHAIEKASYAWK